ncbi:MAG: glycosyltransferase, partial [Minisyncoccota bacterium]
MKLLILTQKIDINDPILGFFHRWVEEFSKNCEKVTVICLEKGEYSLPENVKVLSLGKESLKIKNCKLEIIKKFIYAINFYRYIWKERKNYDAVFVHMNQEYILLGWKLWKLLGKKIMLWRNHPYGSLLTNFAVLVSDRVFCTSKYAYTAKFKKTEIMPVGIDTYLFKRRSEIKKIPNSVLFLGRISPIKNPDVLIESLNLLNKDRVDFNAFIVGDPLPKDKKYYDGLVSKIKKYNL